MPEEPFIDPSQRPDLSIDLDSRVGEITVRQLSEILSRPPSSAIVKQVSEKQIVKENSLEKLPKEPKDIKDSKEHKDPKEEKDQKDTKDHKDPKDISDQKNVKDPKEQKDSKDSKDHKDPKDPKEQKDAKDHKEQKDQKDFPDRKEHIHDKVALTPIESKATEPAERPEAGPVETSGLQDLIQRLSHLEQEVADLKKGSKPAQPS
ncbi:MAG: hypothetical protein JOY96_08300 [Verrucomicrobia bacterium]|nr:hypothetical protein [Verrucomicrobiota bacterium]MBV9673480.1 hypothetical protein [Verrucomicrobiota bacterium]